MSPRRTWRGTLAVAAWFGAAAVAGAVLVGTAFAVVALLLGGDVGVVGGAGLALGAAGGLAFSAWLMWGLPPAASEAREDGR